MEHLSATMAAPKPGMTGTSGDRITRATPATWRSVTLGTMRVCSPPAGSSMAMPMLASPAHLNATCMAWECCNEPYVQSEVQL